MPLPKRSSCRENPTRRALYFSIVGLWAVGSVLVAQKFLLAHQVARFHRWAETPGESTQTGDGPHEVAGEVQHARPHRPLDLSLSDRTIPVYIIPGAGEEAAIGEHRHFIVDGVRKSNFLRLTSNATEKNVVWMVDVFRYTYRSFVQEARRAGNLSPTSSQLGWPVHLFDWTDSSGIHLLKRGRSGIIDIVGEQNLHCHKRSLVKGRRIVEVKKGVPVILNGKMDQYNFHVNRMPYAVRTDIVEGVARVLNISYGIKGYPTNTTLNLATLNRSLDVAHYWPLNRGSKKVSNEPIAKLRFHVSKAIDEHAKEHNKNPNKPNISALIDVQGHTAKVGRNKAQDNYIQSMLEHKIVVVSQRDKWEGHYRLMEALASGALVMTDPMLSLPYGLEEGENVVVYRDMADLKQKIRHYLDNDSARINIASKGWAEAMNRHRSWL
ncbi:hypothetical protein ACHAWF_017122 [Thalassiosira exigua]